MTSSKPFTVAVIGGGIAGVTLAIALLARNIDVNLYERGADFEEIGAGIGLGTNAIKAMTICNPGIKKAFDKVATSSGVLVRKQCGLTFLTSTAGTRTRVKGACSISNARQAHRVAIGLISWTNV
jgi:salicylate hydroxylase